MRLKQEFKRLKKDFIRESSRYSDSTFSVYFLDENSVNDETKFRSPNHAISLWQYMGEKDNYLKNLIKKLDVSPIEVTKFGLKGSIVNALGVIEGTDTSLFVRMANRVGSLIPNSINLEINFQINENFRKRHALEKTVFTANSAPLAKWLNLVLVCISTFQSERFEQKTLAVDPFTASLVAFDYFLDDVFELKRKIKQSTSDEGIYSQILDILKNMSLVMEKNPKPFEQLGEEDLRTHFLVQLNGIFEGKATGETFNYQGKTDILITEKGKNVFIAECKFWRGESVFLETIDQLLSYSSWRDTKTAILVFNRNKNFTDVLNTIENAVPKHTCYKRFIKKIDETSFQYIFHQPEDNNREMTVTIMAFNVPSKS